MRTGRSHLVIAIFLFTAGAGVVGVSPASAHDSDNHPLDHIWQPYSWNGYRIYLSPAHHWDGDNTGCAGYSEETNMHFLGHLAGRTAEGGSLTDRGYKVKLGHGDPDDAAERSNAWGADRHISLHSNAHAESTGCGFTSGGTWVGYYPGSTTGFNLADRLRDYVGSRASPGTSDYTATSTLYELTHTNAPAAYLESEFHDWPTGKNWLLDRETWAWRIGWAVDVHLGYP